MAGMEMMSAKTVLAAKTRVAVTLFGLSLILISTRILIYLLTLPCSPKRNLFPANLLPVVFHQSGMHYPFSCRLGPFHLLHVRAKLAEVTHTHTCNRLILCFRYLVLFVIGVEYR